MFIIRSLERRLVARLLQALLRRSRENPSYPIRPARELRDDQGTGLGARGWGYRFSTKAMLHLGHLPGLS
jgi:hypothetical protein